MDVEEAPALFGRVQHEVESLEQSGPCAGILWGCAQPS